MEKEEKTSEKEPVLLTRNGKPIPKPGRRMSHEEAMEHVFKKFGETLRMLAEHGD